MDNIINEEVLKHSQREDDATADCEGEKVELVWTYPESDLQTSVLEGRQREGKGIEIASVGGV